MSEKYLNRSHMEIFAGAMGVRGDVLPAGRQHERDGAGEADQQVRKQKNIQL